MQVFNVNQRLAEGGEARRSGSVRQAQALGDRAARRVVVDDRTGIHWLVEERDAQRQPGARAEHYLCFDSADTRRRVWRYPSDWKELGDVELLALSERRPLDD